MAIPVLGYVTIFVFVDYKQLATELQLTLASVKRTALLSFNALQSELNMP